MILVGIQNGLEKDRSNSERLVVLTHSFEGVDKMGRECNVILKESKPRIDCVIVGLLTL